MAEFSLYSFAAPVKAINSMADFANFQKSETATKILDFVKEAAEAVAGSNNLEEDISHVSPVIRRFVSLMDNLHTLVELVPPIKQPMRFGNKAFRDWHAKMLEEAAIFCKDILPPGMEGAEIELVAYLGEMFGNPLRIDYGTGHELNFAVFFMLLVKLKLVNPPDIRAVITKGFVSYIRTMRRLQMDYMLEPAGSHGVWGLDDYHCLVFLWGSAQLSKQKEISPSGVHDDSLLREYEAEYIYMEGISFIRKIKVGAPFSETSPMLNDISALHDWAKICSGLMRLFQGEVLNKFPVIQHLLFGNLLPCTWTCPADTVGKVNTNKIS
mmetsp:Transcript_31778/g.53602  ORF Transcript_31778/g.53602 Transcript_31778/m.53602 type:complete len:325 (-) Transcript_31778:2315-3289(-)